ncbi:histidine kinase [Krasilnikovia sp. MM14-A1259]
MPVSWRALFADPRVADGAVVLVCLLLTAFAVKGHWVSLPRPVIALAGLAGTAAQWTRRTRPHLAALAGAVAYPLSGNPAPLLAGLYAAGVHAPRRHLWALAGTGWAGIAGWSWIDDGHLGTDDLMIGPVITGLALGVGVYTATRRALQESLRERAERAEAARVLREEQARASERTRIAREMHDVLAHKVSLIALHAGALELHADGRPVLAQTAGLIRVTARDALQELRTVLGVLQEGEAPAPLTEPVGDPQELVWAATQAGNSVTLCDDAGDLPPGTARVVHRVVREGLTNARKHAPGAPATVTVQRHTDGTVGVTIDNGPPTGAPLDLPGSGAGLIGLAERLRLVGGHLHSGPDGAEGWRLAAVVPWIEHSATPEGRS